MIATRQESRVAFLQPYVPEYRVSLFETLAEWFRRENVEMTVAHTELRGPQQLRRDGSRTSFVTELPGHTLRLRGHEFLVRSSRPIITRSDVVVAELASTNLDVLRAVATSPRKLVLWGHGRSYVTDSHWADSAIERWLARRVAHVLVYTEGGKAALTERGIAPAKITVVRNSTDTTALRRAVRDVGSDAQAELCRRLGVNGRHTALFVGGLDESKNLPLLLEASSRVRASLPDFTLLIAGDGALRPWLLEQLGSHPEIVYVERADRRRLAELGAVCQVCLMPGRVGLVAVDAMVLGLPVVTTDFAYHAPEREYLGPDFCRSTAQTAGAFAAEVVSMLQDPDALAAASAAARQASELYSVEHMARQMFDVIERVRKARAG